MQVISTITDIYNGCALLHHVDYTHIFQCLIQSNREFCAIADGFVKVLPAFPGIVASCRRRLDVVFNPFRLDTAAKTAANWWICACCLECWLWCRRIDILEMETQLVVAYQCAQSADRGD